MYFNKNGRRKCCWWFFRSLWSNSADEK